MLSEFPKVRYNNDILTDISCSYDIIDLYNKILKPSFKQIYFYHVIKDWISPENLAYNYYGSCDFIWVILVMNRIEDPYNDWLLTDDELLMRATRKYGEKLHYVRYYEYDGVKHRDLKYLKNWIMTYYKCTPDDVIYKKETFKIQTITNYEYELIKNNEKRNVKILYPELLPDIEYQIKNIIGK